MRLLRFNPKIKLPQSFRLSRKSILIIVLAVSIPLVSVGSYAGYKYIKAGQLLKECERVYSERNYIRAAFVCEDSANYWFRQHVENKADKAMVLYYSHKDYLAGLNAFGNQKWKAAIDYLSKVNEDDLDYADAVEKISSAKTALAAKEKSKKVAGAKSSGSVVYIPSPTAKKPSTPPKTSAKTKAKLNQLEQKIEKLSTPSTPPQQDSLTLSLTKSEISTIVDIWCLDKDFNLLPYAGSGTIYNSNGYIYTNKHVVQQQNGSVPFTFCAVGVTGDISKPPDYKYWAGVYAYSPSTDVADLTIYWDIDVNELPKNKTFPYLKIGSSALMNPGDPVWLAGYPSAGDGTWTLTEGIISGRVGADLKTDASLSPGNSGGAAINKKKELIGIPTWYLGNLGYIIAIDTVLSLNDWVFP